MSELEVAFVVLVNVVYIHVWVCNMCDTRRYSIKKYI